MSLRNYTITRPGIKSTMCELMMPTCLTSNKLECYCELNYIGTNGIGTY